MLVARIALNEDDVKTAIMFFWKLFDSVFSAACRFTRVNDKGISIECIGGRRGKTYEVYEDMVTIGDISPDPEWTPFTFPIQYAKAIASGRSTAQVSESRYTEDLLTISQEVAKPIVILFDECNVLGDSRALLQRLRNVFMNMPGFMLVLTGTPTLFPVLDEVFSPIARDFKRIDIDAFETVSEARDCVFKPLERIGVKDPRQLIDSETYQDLVSTQGLTGQRPYEIQLLCHFLFRNIQRKHATRMRLDLPVLDDVLRELGRGRAFSSRPIIEGVRKLQIEQLDALGWLCRSNGRATFNQLWFIEYLVHGRQKYSEEGLSRKLDTLRKRGLITLDSDRLTFSGDEFDRIYLKYYARTRSVRLAIAPRSIEALFRAELSKTFSDALEVSALSPYGFMVSEVDGTSGQELLRDIAEQVRSGQVHKDLPSAQRSFLASF